VIEIAQLVFGEEGRAHALLSTSIPKSEIPGALWGLTDRPAFLYQSAQWTTLDRCGPVEGGWAFWRSFDDSRRRAGMVQSHVRFVRDGDIARLGDLLPLFTSLPTTLQENPTSETLEVPELGEEGIKEVVIPEGFVQFVRLWCDQTRSLPVVIPDDVDLLATIRALWAGLWPRARRRIACQTGFGPDTLDLSHPALIVATPVSTLSRWSEYPVVRPDSDEVPREDGVEGYLCGGPAPRFRKLVQQCPDLSEACGDFSKLSRAAEFVQAMHDGSAGVDDLLALVRLLAYLFPTPSQADSVKREAMQALHDRFADSGSQLTTAISNLDLTAFSNANERLAGLISTWVHGQGCSPSSEELPPIVQKALVGGGEEWWRGAVLAGLRKAIDDSLSTPTEPPVWKCLWRIWLAEPKAIAATGAFWPTHLIESDSCDFNLARVCPKSMSPNVAESVAKIAVKLKFSRLHGAALAAYLDSKIAIARQCDFVGNVRQGLLEIARRQGGRAFVAYAAENAKNILLELADSLVLEDPTLMAELNPDVEGWRRIWVSFMKGGGRAFDYVPSQTSCMERLFNAWAKGDAVTQELVSKLAVDPEADILDVAGRADIWTRLPREEKERFLTKTARAWLRRFWVAGGTRPEEPLAKTILLELRTATPGSLAAARIGDFLGIFPEIGESAFIMLFDAGSSTAITLNLAEKLGQHARAQKWSRFADHVYDRWSKVERVDYFRILQQCRDLMSWGRRWYIPRVGEESKMNGSPDLEVFVSYSHQDEPLRIELGKHLAILQRSGMISTWFDRKIEPGQELNPEIDKHLNSAEIILLLISSDFIDSEYCWGVEVKRAMERHEKGEARVIPIILRECTWHIAPFGKLLALPADGKAITGKAWKTPDEAFRDITDEIHQMIKNWLKK
jgi:TIR domain